MPHIAIPALTPPDVTITVTGNGIDRPFSLSAFPRKGPRAGQEVALGGLPSAAALKESMVRLRTMVRTGSRLDDPDREQTARNQGQKLWSTLAPAFRQFYREDLAADGIRSIAVCGPDTFFPWELIWPRDPSVPAALRRNMLGITFSVARWPTRSLPNSITVNAFDAIVGPHVPPGLQEEFGALKQILPLRSSKGASSSDLQQLFATPVPRILHIAAHGTPTTILLQDRTIESNEVERGAFGRFEQPTLVFLNSCRTGGVVVSTEGEEDEWPETDFSANKNWARAFVARSCSACVVPMWNVVGNAAGRISTGFYRGMKSGLSLGEAMQAERRIGVSGDPDNAFHPTRFAYCVYGHPNAKLSFGP